MPPETTKLVELICSSERALCQLNIRSTLRKLIHGMRWYGPSVRVYTSHMDRAEARVIVGSCYVWMWMRIHRAVMMRNRCKEVGQHVTSLELIFT